MHLKAGTEIRNEQGDLLAVAARDVSCNDGDTIKALDWLLPDGTIPQFACPWPDGFMQALHEVRERLAK